MFNFFKKQKERKPIHETPEAAGSETMFVLRRDKVVHSKENIPLLESASRKAGIPIFKGVVKHIYESDFTGYKDKCPRCGGHVLRHFSNFAYATQESSRLLAAPAGLFCLDCDTVIVDDDMMRASIDSSRFQYWGVFSVESGYQEIELIETINGEKPVFILDENQEQVEGFLQSVHQPTDSVYYDPKNVLGFNSLPSSRVSPESFHSQRQPKKKNKAKNMAAKKSRKANSIQIGVQASLGAQCAN